MKKYINPIIHRFFVQIAACLETLSSKRYVHYQQVIPQQSVMHVNEVKAKIRKLRREERRIEEERLRREQEQQWYFMWFYWFSLTGYFDRDLFFRIYPLFYYYSFTFFFSKFSRKNMNVLETNFCFIYFATISVLAKARPSVFGHHFGLSKRFFSLFQTLIYYPIREFSDLLIFFSDFSFWKWMKNWGIGIFFQVSKIYFLKFFRKKWRKRSKAKIRKKAELEKRRFFFAEKNFFFIKKTFQSDYRSWWWSW